MACTFLRKASAKSASVPKRTTFVTFFTSSLLRCSMRYWSSWAMPSGPFSVGTETTLNPIERFSHIGPERDERHSVQRVPTGVGQNLVKTQKVDAVNAEGSLQRPKGHPVNNDCLHG